MDVSTEEVEEVIRVDLSVGVVCQKYEEPGPCGSAGDFLLGSEMEGDSLGREEAKGDASLTAFYNSNDSNQCQFSSHSFMNMI